MEKFSWPPFRVERRKRKPRITSGDSVGICIGNSDFGEIRACDKMAVLAKRIGTARDSAFGKKIFLEYERFEDRFEDLAWMSQEDEKFDRRELETRFSESSLARFNRDSLRRIITPTE